MTSLKVFVDSDVVISSLISSNGAAYLLLNKTQNLQLFISNISQKELIIVTERLFLNKNKLNNLIKDKLTLVNLKDSISKLKITYSSYVSDTKDAHIVAGAVKKKVRFLITYNTKHYKIDKIKHDFGIIILTPALLLQYLRSVK